MGKKKVRASLALPLHQRQTKGENMSMEQADGP